LFIIPAPAGSTPSASAGAPSVVVAEDSLTANSVYRWLSPVNEFIDEVDKAEHTQAEQWEDLIKLVEEIFQTFCFQDRHCLRSRLKIG
jgi:hypothetical protein